MAVVRSMHVIAVVNLAASAAFYRDALGFAVEEMGDPGWRLFVQGACRIMAGECADEKPARELGDHSYFMYLVVDDVESFYARAVAQSVEVVRALRDEPWRMREFGLRTVDGHRIMVGQSLGQPTT